jgi:hypothetical protein
VRSASEPPAAPSSLPSPAAATDAPVPGSRGARSYRRLDAESILATAQLLARRVDERFPRSSLAAVAADLVAIAGESQGRLLSVARPNWPLRLLAGCGVVLLLAGLAAGASTVDWSSEGTQWAEVVQGVEAAINDVVLIAVGLFFLFNLEGRLARRKVLAALHELRSMSHIVDMHQLTKDAEQLLGRGSRTASSPVRTMSRFELSRYLDYCAELLSLIGKVAALHAQDLRDPVVLAAVNEVETLTVGLSNKIWQKIVLVDEIRVRSGETPPTAV